MLQLEENTIEEKDRDGVGWKNTKQISLLS